MSFNKFAGLVTLTTLGLVAGCSASGKGESPSSVASELSGSPGDVLTGTTMQVVGSMEYGQEKGAIAYTHTPRYRAVQFAAQGGDVVDLWVQSTDGDAVAWLLDSSMRVLGHNDDASSTTTDAHIAMTLPATSSGTHYVLFREYDLNKATFDVVLNGTPASFFECSIDADCAAVEQVSCCPDGTHIAVNAGSAAAYEKDFVCAQPGQVCPQHVVVDTRVAECSNTTGTCGMVAIDQIQCSGFLRNAHACPTGYTCDQRDSRGHVSPDVPGHCVAGQ